MNEMKKTPRRTEVHLAAGAGPGPGPGLSSYLDSAC